MSALGESSGKATRHEIGTSALFVVVAAYPEANRACRCPQHLLDKSCRISETVPGKSSGQKTRSWVRDFSKLPGYAPNDPSQSLLLRHSSHPFLKSGHSLRSHQPKFRGFSLKTVSD